MRRTLSGKELAAATRSSYQASPSASALRVRANIDRQARRASFTSGRADWQIADSARAGLRRPLSSSSGSLAARSASSSSAASSAPGAERRLDSDSRASSASSGWAPLDGDVAPESAQLGRHQTQRLAGNKCAANDYAGARRRSSASAAAAAAAAAGAKSEGIGANANRRAAEINIVSQLAVANRGRDCSARRANTISTDVPMGAGASLRAHKHAHEQHQQRRRRQQSAKRADWCDDQANSNNQFNTCHQHSCLRHTAESCEHLLFACSERRRLRREIITSTNRINNTVDCATRCKANNGDDGCRCLDRNYDTKTLFSSQDALSAHTPISTSNNTQPQQYWAHTGNNKPTSATSCTGTKPLVVDESLAATRHTHSGLNSVPLSARSLSHSSSSPEHTTAFTTTLTATPQPPTQAHTHTTTTSTITANPLPPQIHAATSTKTLAHATAGAGLALLRHTAPHTGPQSTPGLTFDELIVANVSNTHTHQTASTTSASANVAGAAPLTGSAPRLDAMDALAQHSLEDRLAQPKTLPNNTLIADLNKCHHGITNLWPQVTASTLLGCWPHWPCRPMARHENKFTKRTRFRFHMPDALLGLNIDLKAADYDTALSVLTNDVRYQLHLLLYRRIQGIWTLLSTVLCVLLTIAFTNLESLVVFGAICLWLGLQMIGALATSQCRKKLDRMLEKSVAQVNGFFMDHNLMLGVIHVGSLLSKSRLLVPMLYFDTSQCREQIESIISIDSRKDADGHSDNLILDYSKIGLPLTRPNVVALAQSLAKKIVLRYSQRWISHFDKRKLMFTDDNIRPRHLSTGKCLCQFIEEHFRNTTSKNHEQAKQAHHETIVKSMYSARTTLDVVDGRQQNNNLVKQQLRSQTHAPLPTLSGLVSAKEHSDSLSIDMSNEHALYPNGYLPARLPAGHQANGFALLQPNTDRNQDGSQQVSHNNTEVAQQQRDTSPEFSLDIDADSISRSDDLVRKLRQLLELRKDELQGIDGSLFSSVLYKVPQQFSLQPDESEHVSEEEEVSVPGDTESNRVKSNSAKKFFTQSGGLFFLGTKKSQQETNPNHILEIC